MNLHTSKAIIAEPKTVKKEVAPVKRDAGMSR